jgi:hypothetical protein
MVDFATLDCAPPPTTQFEFPLDPVADKYYARIIAGLPEILSTMDIVTRVIGRPRVCGLLGDSRSTIWVMLLASHQVISSMVDGGANICLTGILSLLVDVVDIPPLPILVAVRGAGISMADCCTKQGLLPLMLADGSVYYQTCYYCAIAVETIISLQAILDGSDIFVEWMQTGYKDNSPGLLWFSSASGLESMSIILEKHGGLYYTHTDVYTVDKNPVCPTYPTV